MSDSFLLMYDATPGGVDSIPAKAEAVAGYIDGHYQSFPALVRRFYPHAHCISIGVFEGNLAAFSDVEDGNPINTPERVRADFERKRAHQIWRPGYYADRDHMTRIVLPGLSGIPREAYRLWIAEWDGVRVVPAGYDAKQFTNNARNGREGPFDTTLVDIQRFFPHRKPLPDPPKQHRGPIHAKPGPAPHPKVTVGAITGAGATGLAAALNALHVVHITAAEASAGATALAALAAYLFPGRQA